MNHGNRPEILVAVDLGTTYTGVAWAYLLEDNALQSSINYIQDWPGCSTRHEQKVHTCLIYGSNPEHLTSWGFLCEDDNNPDGQRREFFKIFLDKHNLREAQKYGMQGVPDSIEEVQQLLTDYLSKIYEHVKAAIKRQTVISQQRNWSDIAIEFIFSVPTTWRSLEIINLFKDVITAAGFGTEGSSHVATVELTESEAAAVATMKNNTVAFSRGDVFLSVDAGGGTTDFALMQVVEASGPFPTMRQLSQVDGIGIGSTLIDKAFYQLVQQRIDRFSNPHHSLPDDCVESLVRSEKFKTTKHKFGHSVYTLDVYRLPMEGVAYSCNDEGAGIRGGHFEVTKEDMKALFDPHISSMLKKIREQLDLVQRMVNGQRVDYLILSGGLGSSEYVRDRLQQDLVARPHPCAGNIKIIQAPDPQLVVVKGLLLDRMQRLDTGINSVLLTRKARASYGVIGMVKYNAEKHFNQDIYEDKFDGQRYALNQINWLIKKGDNVDPNVPVASPYTYNIDSKKSIREWDCTFVISQSDPAFLPTSAKDIAASKLCTVKSNLAGINEDSLTVEKKRVWYGLRKKKWFVCEFEVRAIVAPADLRFELWFDGQRFSGNHEPVSVTWEEEGTQLGNP